MTQGTRPLNGLVELQGRADSVRTGRVGPLLSVKGTLHHLGFVVASISAVAEEFAVSMPASWDGQIVHDLYSGSRGIL
jgi:hypothetical protein